MKKRSMWIILGAILLAEIVIYLAVVSPQGGIIAEKQDELETSVKRLGRYVRMGRDLPTMEKVRRIQKNNQKLQNELAACVDFYRQYLDSRGLKKWFPGLGIPDWGNEPTPAQFQSVYRDAFKGLRKLLRDKRVAICGKEATVLVELKNGDKIEGKLLRPSPDVAVLVGEGERSFPRDTVKEITYVTRKYSPEEAQMVQSYKRFAMPPSPAPDDTGGGFWETSQLPAQNLRIAQKQYWIQKVFTDALIAAGGKQLVFVSFYREVAARGTGRGPGRGKAEEKKAPQNAVEEHFGRMPVTVLVSMPCGRIAKMVELLNNSGINMELKSLKVTKPLMAEISTVYHSTVRKGQTYNMQQTNGVFPRVMDQNGGVDFGTQPNDMRDRLPGQDQLVIEPPVLVEFSYSVMDMKEK